MVNEMTVMWKCNVEGEVRVNVRMACKPFGHMVMVVREEGVVACTVHFLMPRLFMKVVIHKYRYRKPHWHIVITVKGFQLCILHILRSTRRS